MGATEEVRRRTSRNTTLLYEKYAPCLKRYIRVRVDSSDEAEDIIQDLFVEVCRGDLADRTDVNSEAYLLGMARHLIAKRLRKKERERQAKEKGKIAVPPQEAAEFPTSDVDVERIRMLLETLRPTAREALRLRYLQGLTPKEAARYLGCTETAFHSRLHAAVLAFRALAAKSERISS